MLRPALPVGAAPPAGLIHAIHTVHTVHTARTVDSLRSGPPGVDPLGIGEATGELLLPRSGVKGRSDRTDGALRNHGALRGRRAR
ncbi:hypothetical protein GCM10010145_35100 [Streptomyces ruber]|uniref:Uncharacterized protein n=2 Tax=Streptomyces TaxID=1883 RepID=A0A918ESN9_9ACTN|nr:hypothetical protein GCM10010145_35100 [Streptomyces ruber]